MARTTFLCENSTRLKLEGNSDIISTFMAWSNLDSIDICGAPPGMSGASLTTLAAQGHPVREQGRHPWGLPAHYSLQGFKYADQQVYIFLKLHLTGVIKCCHYLVMVLFWRLKMWHNMQYLCKWPIWCWSRPKGFYVDHLLLQSVALHHHHSFQHLHLWMWRPPRHPISLPLNCLTLKICASVKVYFKAFTCLSRGK